MESAGFTGDDGCACALASVKVNNAHPELNILLIPAFVATADNYYQQQQKTQTATIHWCG